MTAVYVDANNAVLSSSIVYYIVSPLSAYPAPTEMTVEPTEDTGELRVRWGQPANFRPSTDKYEMDYRTRSTTIDPETGDHAWNPWEPDPPMEVASTARIEMQVLTGLDITEHEVRVRAKFVYPNDSTVIVYSDYLTATGTPIQAPTPTTLAKFTAEVTETAGEISMSRPEPAGFDSSKDKYRIMYARMYQSDNTNRRKVFGSGSWESTETTQPTLKWTNLPGHRYLVAAYWIEVDTEDSDNNVWHSMITHGNAWSGDDELEVYPKPMYPASSNFQFGHDGTQLAGTWDEPTGFGSNDVYETQYRDVTRDDRASFSSWTEQTSRTWRLSSTAAAGSYDFRVRAKYKNSSRTVLGYSEWLYGEGQVPSSKAGPTNIQMSHGSSSDLWTWDEPADFDSATDFHQWTVRKTDPNKIPYLEWETVRTTALPRFRRNAFAHIPLEMAMRTKYVDASNNDTYSDWVFVDQPSPEDPANLAYPYSSDLAVDFIQGSDGNYLASWAPPEGFNPLTDGYELQYWNLGSDRAWSSTVELPGTGPGYTLGPVAFQEGWYVQARTKFVDAENNVNYSGYRVQYFSRPAAEESPTGFSLVEHEEGYRIDISWTSHSDFDPFSDKYEIEYQDVAWQNSGVPNYYVQVDVISGTSYVMRGLDWDTVYNFRVRASHYDSNGNFEGYSDWRYQSGYPRMGPGALLRDLGHLTEDVDISDTWVTDYDSVNRSGSYARFYSFTLDQDDQVRIDLESTEDTYLHLLSGAGTNGSVVESDDDDGTGTNSRIVRDLTADDYTVEATTRSSGETGDFTLTVTMPEAKEAPTGLSLSSTDAGGELESSWTAPADFDAAADKYQVQYAVGFVNPDTSEIGYAAYQPATPHETTSESYLLTGLTNVPHSVRVRAAYYDSSDSLEGYSPYVYAEQTPTVARITGLGSLTAAHSVSGSWDSAVQSVNRSGDYNAKWYTFTLGQGDEVQIDLESSEDSYLILLRSHSRNGPVIARDDDGGAGTNSRISRSLSAGDYTIEATTFNPGVTGDFAVSVSFPVNAAAPTITQITPELDTNGDRTGDFIMYSSNPGGFDSATDSFEFQYNDGSGWQPAAGTAIDGTQTSYQFGPITPGDSWQVRLRAKYVAQDNSVTYRDYAAGLAEMPASVSHSAPYNFTVDVTENPGELEASWDNPSGFDSPTDQVELQYRYRYEAPDTEAIVWSPWMPTTRITATGSSHVFTNMGTNDYEIQARIGYRDTANALEGRSDYVRATGTPRAVGRSFDPASNLGLTPTSSGLSLAWTAPGDFDATTDKFQVQYRAEFIDPDTDEFAWGSWTPTAWYQTTNTHFYVTGLDRGLHQIRVRAAYYSADNTLLAYSTSVTASGTPTGNQETADDLVEEGL